MGLAMVHGVVREFGLVFSLNSTSVVRKVCRVVVLVNILFCLVSDYHTLEKLSADVKKYIELQIAYYKIDSLEKSAQASSMLIMAVIVAVLAVFFVIFANLFLAILFAYLLGSWVVGFGVFTGIYLLLLLGLLLASRPIHRFITHRFLAAVANNLPPQKDIES